MSRAEIWQEFVLKFGLFVDVMDFIISDALPLRKAMRDCYLKFPSSALSAFTSGEHLQLLISSFPFLIAYAGLMVRSDQASK